MTAFYERLDDEHVRSTPWTRGPWSQDHQHAGPPAALLGGALAGLLTGGRVTRVAFELLGPVRITDLRIETDLVRPGRRVAFARGALHDEHGPVLLASAWMIRERDVDLEPDVQVSLPPPEASTPARFFDAPWDVGYAEAMELRKATGDFTEPGDAAVWFRSTLDVTDDRRVTPLQRVLLAADSTNGVSARFSPHDWLYVNTDLNVHLRDHPSGEWVGIDAQTRFGPDGIAVATSTVHGEQGAIGVASQSLIIEPQTR